MIRLDITGKNYEVDEKLKAYIHKKLGGLDKYLPRKAKEASGQVVIIEDVSGREDNRFVCELFIKLPGEVIQAKEATVSPYAAADIVEAKAKIQVLKYKDKHAGDQRQVRAAVRKILGRS